jgi:hypothetical protein
MLHPLPILRYKRITTFKGHSSYITHLDRSVDGRILKSNCGAYEILYSEASSGKHVRWEGKGGCSLIFIVYRTICGYLQTTFDGPPHGHPWANSNQTKTGLRPDAQAGRLAAPGARGRRPGCS